MIHLDERQVEAIYATLADVGDDVSHVAISVRDLEDLLVAHKRLGVALAKIEELRRALGELAASGRPT